MEYSGKLPNISWSGRRRIKRTCRCFKSLARIQWQQRLEWRRFYQRLWGVNGLVFPFLTITNEWSIGILNHIIFHDFTTKRLRNYSTCKYHSLCQTSPWWKFVVVKYWNGCLFIWTICWLKHVIRGGSRGGARGARSPLFQTKPPSYLKVWIRHYIITQLSFPMNAKNGRGGGGRLQVSTSLYVCSFFSEVPGLLLCHK